MLEDRQGHLWFGTDAGLVSRYDGKTFQTLMRGDGLTGDSVRAIHQDDEGCMCFDL
jgi:ligand-binding sensor domain-containing protein